MANYATINPVGVNLASNNDVTLSEGNLKAVYVNDYFAELTMAKLTSGKWYWEVKLVTAASGSTGILTGQYYGSADRSANLNYNGIYYYNPSNGQSMKDGTGSSYGNATSGNDILQVALDLENNKIYWGINNTWQNSGDPAAGSNAAYTLAPSTELSYTPILGYGAACTIELNCGQRSGGLAYTPPSGFKELKLSNLTAPTIPRPSDLFVPTRYVGTGQGQRVGDFLPFTDSKDVEFSCLFGRDSSQYMTRTPGSAGDKKKSTLSFWVKRAELGSTQEIFSCTNSSGTSQILFNSSNQLDFILQDTSGGTIGRRTTTMVFVDTTRWINIVCNFDCANTEMEVYVDGTQVTAFGTSSGPTNTDSTFNTTSSHTIGATNSPSNYFDGQLCEIVWTDGQQYDASSFGQTDTSSQKWIPKDVSGLTYGTNGFYLDMADGNDLGKDAKGTNNYTETNMDTTNKTNQLYDSPSHNFPMKFNPDDGGGTWTPTLGNLSTWAGSDGQGRGNFYFDVTDWDGYYFEFSQEVYKSNTYVGIATELADQHSPGQTTSTYKVSFGADRYISALGSASYWGEGTWQTDDTIIGVHVFRNRIAFYIDGTIQETDGVPPACGDLTGGTNGTGGGGTKWWTIRMFNPQVASGGQIIINTGQHMYLSGGATTWREDAGGYFKYAPPTGAKALQVDNMQTFGDNVAITSFNWIKNLDDTDSHVLSNNVSGVTKYLESDDTATVATNVEAVQQFLPKGVGIGTMQAINPDPGTSAEGERVISYNWGSTGTTATNSDGTISGTVTVAANQTAGFSVVSYTGDSGSATKTVGHGLGAVPKFIIVKNTAAADDWAVYHVSLGNTKNLELNTGDAPNTSSDCWNDTTPTSSVFTIGTSHRVNGPSEAMIAYCWTDIAGFSSFGNYTGNANTDGPYIYTGFRPAFVMVKKSNATGPWVMTDMAQNPENLVNHHIQANTTAVQGTDGSGGNFDYCANGFKVRGSGGDINGSNTYIYAAWAEFPFGGSGVSQGKAR